jgi:hypothetical protein
MPAGRSIEGFRVAGTEYGAYWPDLGEGFSLEGLLRGLAIPIIQRESGLCPEPQARRSCASSTTRSWLSNALFARYWQPWLDTGILRTMV